MSDADLTVLVVDDDFRVANMHAEVVNTLPGFTVTATVNTLAGARKADAVDLALVDVYLPDGSGIDFVRELQGDSMVLTAATEAVTIRAAMAAGALSYLVKPFATTELAARLAGYARYRKILARPNLSAGDVDAALDALRPRIATPAPPTIAGSSTKKLVLQALRNSEQPMSAAEVSAAIGISRATAQRYLAALATAREVTVGLRYGTTDDPSKSSPQTTTGQRVLCDEQRIAGFVLVSRASDRQARNSFTALSDCLPPASCGTTDVVGGQPMRAVARKPFCYCLGRRFGGARSHFGVGAVSRVGGVSSRGGASFLVRPPVRLPDHCRMAGTVTVRTTKVSINRPMPMMNPVCAMVDRLPNTRPNIEAAKIMPAEVMTPPVERTARMMPERMPRA